MRVIAFLRDRSKVQMTRLDFIKDINMTTVTENDLKEIKDLIKELKTEIKSDFLELKTEINNKLNDLEKNQIRLETKLDGSINTINAQFEGQKNALSKVPDLAEKVGELKNWKQIAIVIVTTVVSGTITWFLKK
jgi:uncharacterized protein with von Willebrand factor type A (vWA) domain